MAYVVFGSDSWADEEQFAATSKEQLGPHYIHRLHLIDPPRVTY